MQKLQKDRCSRNTPSPPTWWTSQDLSPSFPRSSPVKRISIKNIGISHNREHGEGALRISFYDKASMEAAWARLKRYNYTLFA
ncbi:MAG: hypothetical protein ACLR8P_11065 [Clostridium fessum]